jgi:hypothetical protein
VHRTRSEVLRLDSNVEVLENALQGLVALMVLFDSEGQLGEIGERPWAVSLLVILVRGQNRHTG